MVDDRLQCHHPGCYSYRLELIAMEIGFSDISCYVLSLIFQASTLLSNVFPLFSVFCSLNASLLWIGFLVLIFGGKILGRQFTLRPILNDTERPTVCVRICVYRSRSWVRNLSSVFLPLRVRVLLFHVRSMEGLLDLRQREPTHRRCLHIFPKDSSAHNERKTRALALDNNRGKPSVAIGISSRSKVDQCLT